MQKQNRVSPIFTREDKTRNSRSWNEIAFFYVQALPVSYDRGKMRAALFKRYTRSNLELRIDTNVQLSAYSEANCANGSDNNEKR